eukprot:365727-Chlamydomonas_euryale.AAC.5
MGITIERWASGMHRASPLGEHGACAHTSQATPCTCSCVQCLSPRMKIKSKPLHECLHACNQM